MLLFFGQAAKDPTHRDPNSTLVAPKLRLVDTKDEPCCDQAEIGKKVKLNVTATLQAMHTSDLASVIGSIESAVQLPGGASWLYLQRVADHALRGSLAELKRRKARSGSRLQCALCLICALVALRAVRRRIWAEKHVLLKHLLDVVVVGPVVSAALATEILLLLVRAELGSVPKDSQNDDSENLFAGVKNESGDETSDEQHRNEVRKHGKANVKGSGENGTLQSEEAEVNGFIGAEKQDRRRADKAKVQRTAKGEHKSSKSRLKLSQKERSLNRLHWLLDAGVLVKLRRAVEKPGDTQLHIAIIQLLKEFRKVTKTENAGQMAMALAAIEALLKRRAERLVKLDVTDPQYLEVYTDNRTTSREAYALLIPAMQPSATGATIQLLDLREVPPLPTPVIWCNNAGCGERRRSGLWLRLCSACRLAYYCCRACQREDWKQGHKQRCFEREV
uniref:uncharacterized protein isoform X2 n=1 Tax=Myxine glutinosa TaxID=7769 RepID=UPI00358F9033